MGEVVVGALLSTTLILVSGSDASAQAPPPLCGEGGVDCPVDLGIPPNDPMFLGPPVIVNAVDGCGLVVDIAGLSAMATKVLVFDKTARLIASESITQLGVQGVTIHIPAETYASVGGEVWAMQEAGGVVSAPVGYVLAAPISYETAPFVEPPVYECAHFSYSGGAMPGSEIEFAYDPFGAPLPVLNWNASSRAGGDGVRIGLRPHPLFDPTRARTSLGRGTTAQWLCPEEGVGPFPSESRKVIEYGFTLPVPFVSNVWQDALGMPISGTLIEGQRMVRLAGIEEGAEPMLVDADGIANLREGVWPRGASKEVELELRKPVVFGGEYVAVQQLCEPSSSAKVYGTIECEDAPPPVTYPYMVGDQTIRLRQWVPGYQIRVFHAGAEIAEGFGPVLAVDPNVVIVAGDDLVVAHEAVVVDAGVVVETCTAERVFRTKAVDACKAEGAAYDPAGAPCCEGLVDRPEDASEEDPSASGPLFCLPPCGPDTFVSCGGVDDTPIARLCTAAGRESAEDARARSRAMTSDPGVTCVDSDLDGVCDAETVGECNGADEDCDGTADDAYVSTPMTVDEGDIEIPVLAEDFDFPISTSGICLARGDIDGSETCEMGVEVPTVERNVDFCGMVTERWDDIGSPPVGWEPQMDQVSSVVDPDGSSWNCAGFGDGNVGYEGPVRIFCDGNYAGNVGGYEPGADPNLVATQWDPSAGTGTGNPHAMCPPHMGCTGFDVPGPGQPSDAVPRPYCQPIADCALCWQPVSDGNSFTPPWPPSTGSCS